jgi:hypothetical protein
MEEGGRGKKTQWQVGADPGARDGGTTLRERIHASIRKCTFIYSNHILDRRGLLFQLNIDRKKSSYKVICLMGWEEYSTGYLLALNTSGLAFLLTSLLSV